MPAKNKHTSIIAQDYYPFGMPMPGLNGPANSTYRFGFNGKENDNEIKGFGNQQDYGMRIYDTRIARFLSVDPITKDYPELTPYQFASNTPIQATDLDGLEKMIVTTIINNNNKSQISIINFSENGGPLGEGILYKNYFINNTTIKQNAIYQSPIEINEKKQIKGGSSYEVSPAYALTSWDFIPQKASCIKKPDILTGIELWAESPSENANDAFEKIIFNIVYSQYNSPFILLTGRTLGGTAVENKVDAFVDVAPSFVSFGLSKANIITKTTKTGLQGFNQFVKKNPGIFFGRGQDRAKQVGKLFQQNKIQQEALDALDESNRIINDYTDKTKKEIQK